MREKAMMTAKQIATRYAAAPSRTPEQTPAPHSPVNRILHLQRTAGNQAVQRLVRSGVLQAKLTISQPGDHYEQEADRVAEQVMRMPEPSLQRQPDEEQDEEQIQAKPLAEHITPLVQRQAEPEKEEEEESLQAKEISSQTSTVTPVIESQINALRGGGQPLDPATRAYFEPRFGQDFSGVRVHADAPAAESARAINAQAFTIGRDVVFGAGQFTPGTNTGQKLLAHELTHVVQQTSQYSFIHRQVITRPKAHANAKRSGPQLLLTGQKALAAIAQILPTAHKITVPSALGDVELRPGAIWSNDKILVYAAPMYVYYAIGDRLYEYGTSDFVRNEWFNALSRGAARAMPMVYLAQIEMALLQGIFVPWYLMLGMGVAKIGLFYHNHRSQVDAALQQIPTVIRVLSEFRRRYPTLFNKLLTTAARDILTDLPAGVTAEDVAFFMGRVLRGVIGLPDVTLGAVLRISTTVATIVTATHLPSITAHAITAAAQKQAAALQTHLAKEGISVSEEEARIILRELLSHRDTGAKLRELESACQQLIPILNQLKVILRAGGE